MGRIVKMSLLFSACVLALIPSLFGTGQLWLGLSVLVYAFFGLVFWFDEINRRELTWVMLALAAFSAIVGLGFWHRLFRVGFWIALFFSETKAGGRKRFWWLEWVAFLVWGMSLMFTFSSWNWWVGAIDAMGWLLLGSIFLLDEQEETI